MMGNVEESEHFHRYTIETHAVRTIRLENPHMPAMSDTDLKHQAPFQYPDHNLRFLVLCKHHTSSNPQI